MNRKFLLAFAIFALVTVSIQALTIHKRQAPEERPEAPGILECDEPGENRENCFYQDPSNAENFRVYLQEVEDWEKKNADAAKTYYEKNPNKKKEEKDLFEQLQAYAALHE